MTEQYSILSTDVVTSLGIGLEQTWSAMISGAQGIGAMERFEPGRYRSDVAGEVQACGPLADGASSSPLASSWAWRLAHTAAAGAMARRPQGHGLSDGGSTGLVLATIKADFHQFASSLQNHGTSEPRLFDPFVLARELAGDLGLSGPVMAVSSACASGLAAIIQATRLIRRGQARQVLVVGVDVLSEFILEGFSALNALSPRPCRPFDAARDGLTLGEGAGAMLLAAASENDCALARVSGWGASNDAHHITGPSPVGEGLIRALQSAMKMGGLNSDEIDFVNAHGTGTVYNDEMEAKALSTFFGDSIPPVASMKGYIGHTLGAAGVIEAALCTEALRHRTVPATMGFEELGVTKPIPVCSQVRRVERMRNVATLKSGFGGVNAVVIISSPGGDN